MTTAKKPTAKSVKKPAAKKAAKPAKKAAVRSAKKAAAKPAVRSAAKKAAAKKPSAKAASGAKATAKMGASKKAIRPGWSTKVRAKKYAEVEPELWKRVAADLRDVGPDTFDESASGPYSFHELLNKGEKYVLIHSCKASQDSLFVFEFAGDPVAKYNAFFEAILNKITEDDDEAYE